MLNYDILKMFAKCVDDVSIALLGVHLFMQHPMQCEYATMKNRSVGIQYRHA